MFIKVGDSFNSCARTSDRERCILIYREKKRERLREWEREKERDRIKLSFNTACSCKFKSYILYVHISRLKGMKMKISKIV